MSGICGLKIDTLAVCGPEMYAPGVCGLRVDGPGVCGPGMYAPGVSGPRIDTPSCTATRQKFGWSFPLCSL